MPIDISTLKPFCSNTSHYQIQLRNAKIFRAVCEHLQIGYKSYIHEMQKCKIFLEGFWQQIDVYKSNLPILLFFRQENLDIGGFLVQLQNHRSLRQDLLQ